MKKSISTALAVVMSVLSISAFADDLTVYSGRGKNFVEPVIKTFEQETGIKVKVRYAGTPELLALLKEEQDKTPADVFWAQDGYALSSLEKQFTTLPNYLYKNQLDVFQNKGKKWVAITARTRTVAYSPERVVKTNLPESIMDFTDKKWGAKIGWAPGNASFQSFVTIMRSKYGEAATANWLKTLKANGAKTYKNNSALIQAIADGEIDVAFVNNYYLPRFKAKDPKFPVEQTFLKDGDIANALLITGAAITNASKQMKNADRFIQFLLKPTTQQYLSTEGNEYPVIKGTITNVKLNTVNDISKASPSIPLDQLTDIEGTRTLLREAGLI